MQNIMQQESLDHYSLVHRIVELGVPKFGVSLKNKGDSPSCMFDPRILLSDPISLAWIGKKLGELVSQKCRGDIIVGMASSGIPWATLAGFVSRKPVSYIRKPNDHSVSNNRIEGFVPDGSRIILVDDLLFAGESKREALEYMTEIGLEVTDIVVIIDRQLQRRVDGEPIQLKFNANLHYLVDMDDIVAELLTRKALSDEQLKNLISDYNLYERWRLPSFADKSMLSSFEQNHIDDSVY